MDGLGLMFLLFAIPMVLFFFVIGCLIEGWVLKLACSMVSANQPTVVSAAIIAFCMRIVQGLIYAIVVVPLMFAGVVGTEQDQIVMGLIYAQPLIVPVSAFLYSRALQITLSKGVYVYLAFLLLSLLYLKIREGMLEGTVL